MKRPLIGLTPFYNEKRQNCFMDSAFLHAVEAAGGIPLVLPLTRDEGLLGEISGRLDGFLFTGGQDVAPELYGERALPECGPVCQERDEMELRLLRFVTVRDKPLLGVCRGIQLANAALGGTLYQDLPSQKPSEAIHRQAEPYSLPAHEVTILPNTPLDALPRMPRSVSVNSLHHQAIKRLSPRLCPMAISGDGLIEAAWMPEKRFIWLIQWHPELMPENDPASGQIFSAFVQAAMR